ncbi:unnamed protein product [Effrenium voratum]|uniref:Uncharacterized protein n=1 Tax=Effrenium voratum TaxID=2562239 RepID=A0AA36MH28_9DINO|nr:unnamed protein product [Effrenium voratum]CAJ1449631.1 unnamed protein product [Effrenium voratum]
MCSLHTGTWSGLPLRDDAALRKKRDAREKAWIAEVAALDERPQSRETLIRWNLDNGSKDVKGRVLPAPWAPRQVPPEWDIQGLALTVTRSLDEGDNSPPHAWDKEMIQLCGATGRAELRGRAVDLVEPYVPLMKPARKSKEVELLHRQMPSPSMDRGSGFCRLEPAKMEATVRYNLRLDGRRPFMAGAAKGKDFTRVAQCLPQKDLAAWDQERIMAPERAYRSSEKGACLFQDERRLGPAWKPAGKNAGQLSRAGASIMR